MQPAAACSLGIWRLGDGYTIAPTGQAFNMLFMIPHT